AIEGPQYEMFAPRRQAIPPLIVNTRVYSCSLINNHMGQRYRDVYNDDTDICLRALKAGWCTVQFNAFLAKKMATMRVKGGNTPIYLGIEIAQAEWNAHAKDCSICKTCIDGYTDQRQPCDQGKTILAKDGRWRMADSLLRQHPDVTTITHKWDRWQHQVDYRRFRDNPLVLRADVVVPTGTNDYGMALSTLTGEPEPARKGKPEPKPEPARASGPSALEFALREPEKPASPAPPAPAEPSRPGPSQTGACLCTGTLVAALHCPLHGAPGVKAWLASRGHRLLLRDGKFFVSEASRLSDADRALIKQHREALIALAEPWEDIHHCFMCKEECNCGATSVEGPFSKGCH